jgi:MFS family permease
LTDRQADAPGRWFILAVLVAARMTMGFQFQSVASISPVLVEALAIDYAELGALIGFYMLPGVVIALPSGILGRRYGDANMVLAGLLAMGGGGLVMGFGETYAVVSVGRVMAGAGAVFLNVLMVKMVTDWFSGRQIVVAIAILISSWPLGIGLGLISFPAIATAWSWQMVMHVSAAVAFGSFLLLVWKYSRAPGARDRADEGFGIGLLGREWLLILLAGLVWGTFNVGFIVILSFGPDFFAAQGYSLGEAGAVVSLAGWLAIPLVPLGGYVAGRYGRQTAIILLCLLIAAGGMIYLGFTTSPVAVFTLSAMVGVFPAALIVALPPEVLRPSARGAGLGLFFTLFYACMAVLPGVAGWTRDVTGDPAAPFYFGALMMICASFSLLLFRFFQRRAPLQAKV